MPEVEAHITGTVWKIEVAVGDEIDEGDTVVILESQDGHRVTWPGATRGIMAGLGRRQDLLENGGLAFVPLLACYPPQLGQPLGVAARNDRRDE